MERSRTPVRGWLRGFLGALLALWALALPLRALAVPLDVTVDRFKPTQRWIGKASARVHLDAWRRDAKLKGLSLGDYARQVLEPTLAGRVIPVVLDPHGYVRNTDGHHKIAALIWLREETGVALTVETDVIADYRGQSERAFAEDFVGRLKKGWFGRRTKQTDAVALMRSLPSTYAQLRDDPVRSSVDTAFETLGLQGRMFHDYVEFHVAHALARAGLFARLRTQGLVGKGQRTIDNAHVFDEPVVAEIRRMLREPRLRGLLLENARSEPARQQIAAILDAP